MTEVSKGDFSFINNYSTRVILEDIYNAIDKNELWDYIKEDKTIHEYNMVNYRQKDLIIKTMQHYYIYINSFDWSLDQMQSLAKKGWESYVSEWGY
jgi:hypothetical protein